MTDEKKSPTIVTLGVGGSLPTGKIFGPPDPRYQNGGEAASVALSVQRKIAVLGSVDISGIGGVAASAFAPSKLTTPDKTLGPYALERPPALAAEANLGLLATLNHEPGKGGFFGAAYVGAGLRRSYELSAAAVTQAKTAALDALKNGINQKEAAAAAIAEGRNQLEAGRAEHANGLAALEAGRAELATRTHEFETRSALLQTNSDRFAAESARLALEQARLDQGRETFAEQQRLLAQQQQTLGAAQQQFAVVNQQQAPVAKVNPAVQQALDAQAKALSDSQAELEKGRAQLAAAEQQINSSAKQLSDGAAQLAGFEAQLAQGRVQLAAAEQQLSTGKQQLVQGETRLSQLLSQIQDGENRLSAAEVLFAASPVLPGLGETRSQLDQATFIDRGFKPFARGFAEAGATLPLDRRLDVQAAATIAAELGAGTKSYSTGVRVAIGSLVNGLPRTVYPGAEGSGIIYTPDPEVTKAGAFKLEGKIYRVHTSDNPYLPNPLTNRDTSKYSVEAALALSQRAVVSGEYGCQNNPSSGIGVPPNLGITADKGPSKNCSGKVTFTTRF